MNNVFLILLLALLSSPGALAGQSAKADSLQRVLVALPPSGDTVLMQRRAETLYALAVELHRQKMYGPSRVYYREALQYFINRGLPRPLANVMSGIGFSYHFQGRFPEALDTFLLSLKYYELARDTGKLAQIASTISNIYWEMPEQRDKAMVYARYCMEVSARAHRLHGLCACTHLVGDVYTQMGKLDSAAIFIQQSLKLLETQPDLPGLVTVYLAMSRLEEKKQHYDLEEIWLQKALSTQKKYPNGVSEEEQTNTLLALGNAGLNRRNPGVAAQYFKEAAVLMPKMQDITYHERYYEGLSRLAEMEHRPEEALRYFKMHIAARDSSRNEENTRRMTQAQMNYDFEKKEAVATAQQQQELALRDARSRQQQLLFALTLLIAAGGGAFGFFYYRQQQERRRTELELANLRAQINPHFIFNCLNSIYRYTKERDTETAGKYLQKFSSLLRLVLENSRHEKIPLAKDLEALRLYVDIESLRFKDKLRFQLDIDPEIDTSFTAIPGMLLQPHVENAIWHGIMNREAGGQITVRLRQATETMLHVEIEDNGVGRAASSAMSTHPGKKSLGQKITEKRLKATGKLAKTEMIDLFDDEGNAAGTRVMLDIPL